MKILYISQVLVSLESEGIYSDLVRALVENGADITLVSADANAKKTELILLGDGLKRLSVKVSNQFGVNLIKKALSLLSIQGKFIKAIKKYLKREEFDLVLYATPPVTFEKVIRFAKRKYDAKSYLMLKDIFPQNAVDLGMLKYSGIKGCIYRFFRKKEERLYAFSDKIGCTSEANIRYVVEHNDLPAEKLEIFPNALIVKDFVEHDKSALKPYDVEGKTTFIFGGNLGKPQGLSFLCEGIASCESLSAHFFIVGKGSEKEMLWRALSGKKNVTLLEKMPQKEYNSLCSACDVGIISLDKRFTVPNCPARLLSYIENAMPVLACTDAATDIKELLIENDVGVWSLSGDIETFRNNVAMFCACGSDRLKAMGQNGRRYFEEFFDVRKHIHKLEI